MAPGVGGQSLFPGQGEGAGSKSDFLLSLSLLLPSGLPGDDQFDFFFLPARR